MIKFKIIAAALIAALIGLSAGKAMSAEMPSHVIKISDKHYTYNLNHELDDAKLAELIAFYKNAEPGTVLDLIIDSPGGRVSSTMNLINEMLSMKVRTSCTVKGMAASGAALTLMACGKIDVTEGSIVLFHAPFIYAKDGYYTRNPFVVEEVTTFMNNVFCFRSFVGQDTYEQYLMGHDIVYTKKGFDNIVQNSCRIKGDLKVYGH